MATTFRDLCNKLLRRLNEVEIESSLFNDTRGVQALAKDAVRNAITQINQQEYEWPFNAATYDQLLIVGQTDYSWPSDLKIVDWHSFYIQKDDGLGTQTTTLNLIDRDEYIKLHRNADLDAGSDGRGIPNYVFRRHGSGFSVSPSPDKAYSVRYDYYRVPETLTNAADESRVPSEFDYVIVDAALYHMYMFKDNIDAANTARQSFEVGLKSLQSIYINSYDYVRDTRIAF